MCDNFKEQFAENHRQLLDEIEQEKELYGEVEGLRNAVTDKIQDISVQTNRVPVVSNLINIICNADNIRFYITGSYENIHFVFLCS